MMGSMMGGLAKAAEVADKAKDGAFAKVGEEVAGAKVDAIIAVYREVINGGLNAQSEVLVRGAAPHGPEEAAACAKDAVSAYISDNAKKDLVDKMLPVCKAEVEASTACKTWKQLIESYNTANEKLGSLGEIGAKVKQEPITLDVETYIVEQIVLGYRELMATKEAAIRKDPKTATVPEHQIQYPTTFERCWDVSPNGINYADFKSNHFVDFKGGV